MEKIRIKAGNKSHVVEWFLHDDKKLVSANVVFNKRLGIGFVIGLGFHIFKTWPELFTILKYLFER